MTRPRPPRFAVIDDKGEPYAERKDKDNYPSATERSGKWLCFIYQREADDMWSKVAQATELGELGSFSVFRRQAPNHQGRVIEVHTYDWTDVEDVRRIREALRRLGWLSPVPYKADADSAAGTYKETGSKSISKYYE